MLSDLRHLLRPIHFVALAVLVGSVAALGWLTWWGWLIVRAVFLPGNFLQLLHFVEVGLLALLAVDLVLLLWPAMGSGRSGVRLPGGRRVVVGRGVRLGSRPGWGGLVVPGATVSGRHLEVRPGRRGGLEVVDLGSTNGTFLDGQDLRGRGAVALAVGSRLELGRGGPAVEAVELPPVALLGEIGWLVGLVALMAVGLFLGWRANLDRLPPVPLAVGDVGVSFRAFREAAPVLGLGAAAAALLGLWLALAHRRAVALLPAARAVQLFTVVGLVLLYPLLPAVAMRYGEAAQRAQAEVDAADWEKLEAWEDAGGATASFRCGARSAPALETIEPSFPKLAAKPAALRSTLCRYKEGREALRWAVNLGGLVGAPAIASTYFRQAGIVLAALGLAFVVPLAWPRSRRFLERLVEGLGRPLSRRLVRAADGGSRLAGLLRPLAYRDLLLGFLAAALVAATLLFGTSHGRGKSLFLDLPGLPSLQTLELVKALFVLFVAGYFARQGELLARVPRGRYLLPWLAAVLATLGLTAVQADMGGLFMLGLFLALLFIAATGNFRLLGTVPLLLLPGLALAWWLGKASILQTRLALWLAPREHPLGEQLVQARQLLLSSGWAGYPPAEARAWLVPDIQGDLVLAALAERFGFVGLAAVLLATFALGVALLRSAPRAEGPRRLLLAGVAALALVQVATQAGGLLGLLPLTGVPVPWLSQGLTASLVFTLLVGLAVAVGPSASSPAPAPGEGRHLVHLARANALAGLALVALAALWTVALPGSPAIGPLGAGYRWRDPERAAAIAAWVDRGYFEPSGTTRVTVDVAAFRRGAHESGVRPALIDLAAAADGLRRVDGQIVPLPWLVSNPNWFADRSRPRGRLLDRSGTVLAMTVPRSGRHYPLGKALFHPIGQGAGAAMGFGVEGAARPFLSGVSLTPPMRLRSFVGDVHDGPDLVLTLDAGLQRQAYSALAGRPGAAVVMELPTGALLALASSPSVDPEAASVEQWRTMLRDGGRPLLDCALRSTDAYSPPGSAFKILMAAAVLSSKSDLDPNEKITCPGYDPELRVTCAHGKAHGRVDLARALTVSCNIYFARVAVRLGPEEIRRAAERFGLNAPAAPDLLRGVPGAELRPGLSTVLDGDPSPRPRDLARVGYGQGPVSLTPLDLARMGAVIATGGELVDPYLAEAVRLSYTAGEERRPVWQDRVASPAQRRAIPGLVADQLDLALREVFDSPEGTGHRLPKLWRSGGAFRLGSESPGAGWERVPVAGKTGSAWRRADDSSDDAWMVAWAPAGAPRVVVATMVENAGEGGKVAGPIALELLRSALTRLERGGEEE